MGTSKKNQTGVLPEKSLEKGTQPSKKAEKRVSSVRISSNVKAITFAEMIGLKYPHQLINDSGEWDDFLPRFIVSKVERIEGRFLPRHEQKFRMGRTKMKLMIVPPQSLDPDGIRRNHYPGEREALLELCLIKLAAENPGNFDGYCTLIFRISRLQQTLEAEGWHYTIPEIELAINVHSGTALILQDDDGEFYFRAIDTISVKQLDDGDLFYSLRLGGFLAARIKNLISLPLLKLL